MRAAAVYAPGHGSCLTSGAADGGLADGAGEPQNDGTKNWLVA